MFELLTFKLTGVKLYTTMHIRNVTFEHDSVVGSLGRYECHAYAFNDSVPKRHGFTVNVIPSKLSAVKGSRGTQQATSAISHRKIF